MEKSMELKKEISKVWDEEYKIYDSCYQHGIKSRKEEEEWMALLARLLGEDTKRVLDVGAGTGFLSVFVARLGHQCKGIDLSEGMLSVARKKAEAEGLVNLQFAIGDAEDTGEKEESYDIVMNRHLVWTLPHPQQAIRDWMRVLKPGGSLIIIDGDWFYNKPANRIKVFLGKLLVSIQERRNGFAGHGDYAEEVIEKLPMMHSSNARNLEEMVRRTGARVQVVGAEKIEAAEKAAMPLAYRLMNPYKRKVIIAEKVAQ